MRRVLLLSILPAFLFGCRSEAPSTILTVEAQPQQTIKGWGIYPCTIQNDRPNAADYTLWSRPNAARLIWKELGISFWRCEILPTSYDAVKNDGSLNLRILDDSLVRQIRLADRYGRKPYILTVWSPPALFKDPPVTFGADPKTRRPAHLRQDREDAYCRYVVHVFDYLTKVRQLPAPLAYSIQNEPNYAADQWNGTPYEAEQWRRVTKKMRRALDAGGYGKVKLIGPECGSYEESLAFLGGPTGSALLKDAEFNRALSGFAFHGYSYLSRRSPYPQRLRELSGVLQKQKKDIWLSEYSIIAPKRIPLDHTLEVMQRLGRETAYIPCNYWTWWQGYYPRHPKSEVLLTGRDDNALHISKTYTVLQKLWHSAPAGSIVHRVKSSDSEIKGFAPDTVQTVAFERDGRITVLVINPTKVKKSLQINGLKGRNATSYITDEKRDMKAQSPLPISHGSLTIALGARSILVLVTNQISD